MKYVWKDLVSEVMQKLTKDSDNISLSDFIQQSIRTAVSVLQDVIPQFQTDSSVSFVAEELGTQGHASMGSLPSNIQTTEWWIVDRDIDGSEPKIWNRRQVFPYPKGWSGRFDLVNGSVCATGTERYYTVGPDGASFMLFPALPDSRILVVHFDGVPASYSDNMTTGFPKDPAVAEAIYAWVKAAILRDIEQEPGKAAVFDNMARSRNDSRMGIFQRMTQLLYSRYGRGLPL